MSNKKVLVVEDDLTIGDLLVEAMTRHGYQVSWYVRARFDQSGALTFMNDRGVETNFDDSSNQNNQGYGFALVDWRLKGSSLQGVDVTSALTKRGLKVIGKSGLNQLNEELVEAGAVGYVEKFEVFNLIKDEARLQRILEGRQ